MVNWQSREHFDSCLSEVPGQGLLMRGMPTGKVWIKGRERQSQRRAKMSVRGNMSEKEPTLFSPKALCSELFPRRFS